MKIELNGWTLEDGAGKLVWKYLYTKENTAAEDHLKAKGLLSPGVTALTVAAELERYLKEGPDTVAVGKHTVARCAGVTGCVKVDGKCLGLDSSPFNDLWKPGMTVTEVGKAIADFLSPKDIVVFGYTVDKDAKVSYVPEGYHKWPAGTWKTWKGFSPGSNPVIKYLMDSRDALATQADVVAKITEYFEGPRVVKGYTLHRWKCEGRWYVRDSKSAALIGRYDPYGPVGADFRAAQAKFKTGEPSLPEVAEFIENWREPAWHGSTLRCERDDKDDVVIPTPDGQFIRLNLGNGRLTAHRTAEEAKR